MNIRTDIFHSLLFAHKNLHDAHKAALAAKKTSDDQLAQEKAEVSRLVKELKRIDGLRKSETEKLKDEKDKAVEAEKKLREDSAKDHQEALQVAEVRANSATEALEALQAQVNQFLPTLQTINNEMDSEFLASLSFSLSSTPLVFCRTISHTDNRLPYYRAFYLHPSCGPQHHWSAQGEAERTEPRLDR